MEKFYIDRQFHQPLWIDVENGIVKRCYNDTPGMINKMNEMYVGKSINFLNEDFIGRAMKGTYHHLRPDCITTALRHIESLKMRIQHLWNEATRLDVTKDNKSIIKRKINELEGQKIEAERLLKSERERITKEHDFEWKTQRDFKSQNKKK